MTAREVLIESQDKGMTEKLPSEVGDSRGGGLCPQLSISFAGPHPIRRFSMSQSAIRKYAVAFPLVALG